MIVFLGACGRWEGGMGSGSLCASTGGGFALMNEKDRAEADKKWREEAKFAGMHELGMCLRWRLARVVRIQTYSSGESTTPSPGEGSLGTELRGLIPWEHYTHWRDQEAALGYYAWQSWTKLYRNPPTDFRHFRTFSGHFRICRTPFKPSKHLPHHRTSLENPANSSKRDM